MKAHIVGGGFGGLAAAVCFIEHAKVPGADITIYEAHAQPGGAFSLGGSAQTGYVLPSGALFDADFRCAYALLDKIPWGTSNTSVKEQFFRFNKQYPFDDKAHVVDRNGQIVHDRHFGLSLPQGLQLVRLALMPEAALDGRLIEDFFTADFYKTEFWILWSTTMGSLPQHSAVELRRYLNRLLALFPYLSDMAQVLRTPLNQYEAFIEPMVDWLKGKGVTFLYDTVVTDLGLAAVPGCITVERLDYRRKGKATSVAVGPDDRVLVTLGSQADDLSIGAMDQAPAPHSTGQSWALWARLAQGRTDLGNPGAFFGPSRVPLSRWVTFTVTTTGREFLDLMRALTNSEPGTGGIVTLKDSPWVVSLSIFHQPEVANQPCGSILWWGYGLFPQNCGTYVGKPMNACTGREILEEVVRQLRFDAQLGAIMTSSFCIPCDLPYANNIWMPRRHGDRPLVVPDGATNLALLGQYAEVPQDIAFTIEYSARTAWEAVYRLLGRGPPPPPVYQGQYDPKALAAALKVFAAS